MMHIFITIERGFCKKLRVILRSLKSGAVDRSDWPPTHKHQYLTQLWSVALLAGLHKTYLTDFDDIFSKGTCWPNLQPEWILVAEGRTFFGHKSRQN